MNITFNMHDRYITLHLKTFSNFNDQTKLTAMKILLFSILTLLFAGCINSKTGSGNIISKTMSVGNFIAISAAGDVHVIFQNGLQRSVVVETDDNIMPYVETETEGNTLKIRLKKINNLRNCTINVNVTSPNVTKFSSSASAEIISKSVITSSGKLELRASSGSKIDLLVNSPSVDVEASSGGNVITAGRTKDVLASASSGSNLNTSALRAENADARASSGASVKVYASISVQAEASSGGTVKYTGGAEKVKKNESSGGSVVPYPQK